MPMKLTPELEADRKLLAEGTAPEEELKAARKRWDAYEEKRKQDLRDEAEGKGKTPQVPDAAFDSLVEYPLYANGRDAHATPEAAQIVGEYLGLPVTTQGTRGVPGQRQRNQLPPQELVGGHSAGLLLKYLFQTPYAQAVAPGGLPQMLGNDWQVPAASKDKPFSEFFAARFQK